MALDLIDKIEEAMQREGDSPDDFKITGALLFLTAEKDDDDGWTFCATNPHTEFARHGLTELASKVVRRDYPRD